MATTIKRERTEAQKRASDAASERFRLLRERKQAESAGARDVTDREVMVAELAERRSETVEDAARMTSTSTQSAGLHTTVTHRGPLKVRVYDGQGNMRVVPSSFLSQLFKNGFYPVCPICGSKHVDNGFNACAGREPVLYTTCPVCARYGRYRPIPDERLEAQIAVAIDDPMYVPIDIGVGRDARERVASRLKAHIVAYHETVAREMGLLPGQNNQAPQVRA